MNLKKKSGRKLVVAACVLASVAALLGIGATLFGLYKLGVGRDQAVPYFKTTTKESFVVVEEYGRYEQYQVFTPKNRPIAFVGTCECPCPAQVKVFGQDGQKSDWAEIPSGGVHLIGGILLKRRVVGTLYMLELVQVQGGGEKK